MLGCLRSVDEDLQKTLWKARQSPFLFSLPFGSFFLDEEGKERNLLSFPGIYFHFNLASKKEKGQFREMRRRIGERNGNEIPLVRTECPLCVLKRISGVCHQFLPMRHPKEKMGKGTKTALGKKEPSAHKNTRLLLVIRHSRPLTSFLPEMFPCFFSG